MGATGVFVFSAGVVDFDELAGVEVVGLSLLISVSFFTNSLFFIGTPFKFL